MTFHLQVYLKCVLDQLEFILKYCSKKVMRKKVHFAGLLVAHGLAEGPAEAQFRLKIRNETS